MHLWLLPRIWVASAGQADVEAAGVFHIRECIGGAFEELLRQYEQNLHLPLVFESPLEETFAELLEKHMDPAVRLRSQVGVTAGAQRFRLDFVAESTATGRRVGIECDGKHFHEASRDDLRDRAILATGAVDAIYRVAGSSLYWRPNECLLMSARGAPWMFSPRGHVNVERLAALEALLQLEVENDDDDEDAGW